MPIITFNLDPAFFAELSVRCEAERARINEVMGKNRAYVGGYIGQGFLMPTEIHEARSIPSGDRMRRLIETAFWASMEREEGRALAFNIAYGVSFGENDYVVKFESPLPFDVRATIKLAPATRDLPSVMAIGPTGDGGLEICGL